MPRTNAGRVIVAAITGWVANAMLVGITEVLLWMGMRSPGGKLPGKYYVIDLVSQSCYTVLGGYLCCLIARPPRLVAMFCMMSLGLLIGGLSLPSSWPREPHWYRIALLAVWAPCVLVGWRLRSHHVAEIAGSAKEIT